MECIARRKRQNWPGDVNVIGSRVEIQTFGIVYWGTYRSKLRNSDEKSNNIVLRFNQFHVT